MLSAAMPARMRQALAYLRPDVAVGAAGPAVAVAADDAPIARGFAPGLHTSYLVDEGDSFTYLQARDLRTGAVSVDALHRQAVANLARLAEGRVRLGRNGPVWAAFLDGNFEASLILLDDLWDRVLVEYGGRDPVVAIPARDILAFCSASSKEGVAELHAVVGRVWPQGDHLLSEKLYRRVDGGWVVHGYARQ